MLSTRFLGSNQWKWLIQEGHPTHFERYVTSDPGGLGRCVIHELHTKLTWGLDQNGYFGQSRSSGICGRKKWGNPEVFINRRSVKSSENRSCRNGDSKLLIKYVLEKISFAKHFKTILKTH